MPKYKMIRKTLLVSVLRVNFFATFRNRIRFVFVCFLCAVTSHVSRLRSAHIVSRTLLTRPSRTRLSSGRHVLVRSIPRELFAPRSAILQGQRLRGAIGIDGQRRRQALGRAPNDPSLPLRLGGSLDLGARPLAHRRPSHRLQGGHPEAAANRLSSHEHPHEPCDCPTARRHALLRLRTAFTARLRGGSARPRVARDTQDPNRRGDVACAGLRVEDAEERLQ